MSKNHFSTMILNLFRSLVLCKSDDSLVPHPRKNIYTVFNTYFFGWFCLESLMPLLGCNLDNLSLCRLKQPRK